MTRSLLSRLVTVAAVVALAAACGGAVDGEDAAAPPTTAIPAEDASDDADDADSDQQPDAPTEDDEAAGEADAPDGTDGGTATDGGTPEDTAGDEPVASEGDCSAAGTAPASVVEVADMPAEVAALRDLLADAALRCDEQLLFTAIEESGLFSYSFGDQGDAIGFWWELEAAGDEPYRRIVDVLSTTPALADGGEVWVWPGLTTGREETRTPELLAELDGWADEADLGDMDGAGYLGWRIGISTDGEWRFFVRGD